MFEDEAPPSWFDLLRASYDISEEYLRWRVDSSGKSLSQVVDQEKQLRRAVMLLAMEELSEDIEIWYAGEDA